MKDNGIMTKPMDMELINMPMVQPMSVTGLKISSMEKVLKSGLMVLNTKAITKMTVDMGAARLPTQTRKTMKEKSKIPR